jgi:hypothetical protein
MSEYPRWKTRFFPVVVGGLCGSLAPPAVCQTPIVTTPGFQQAYISENLLVSIGRGDDPDGQIFGTPLEIGRVSDGRLLLLTEDGGAPQVYDRNGIFEGRIGRRGAGPMEFRRPAGARALPGDSILILDPGLGRATVFSADGGQRTVSGMPSVFGLDVLKWPLVISYGDIRTPARITMPFHLLDFSGATVRIRSTSGEPGKGLLPWEGLDAWSLCRVSDSSFWAIGGPEYALELWDTAGIRHEELVRTLDEYDSGHRYGLGNPGTPPPARVMGSQLTEEGLLWVYLLVPRYDWHRAWEGVVIDERGGISLSQSPDILHDLYQTRIDVIDLRGGELLGSGVTPGMAIPSWGFQSPTVAKYRIGRDGIPLLELWELSLSDPHSRSAIPKTYD